MAATLEQRAQRRAARANARQAKRYPLLAHAGLAGTKTPAEAAAELRAIAVDLQAHWRRFEEQRRQAEAMGQWLRAFVACRVDAQQLGRLDHRRGSLPDDGAYTADFWGNQLRKVAPAVATACGHPPVRDSLPINRVVARHHMKADPAYRRRIEAICARHDEAQRQRQGGVQLALPTRGA